MQHPDSHIFLGRIRGRLRIAKVALGAVALVVLLAAPAFAYVETSATTNPEDTNISCATCHGRESAEETGTIVWRDADAKSRKGPHGGYTTGTSKCQTCHSAHGAAAGGRNLLPAETIAGTCNTCHDGTGGGGVYGVIERRGGVVAGGHMIDSINGSGTVTIPGGDPNGGSLDTTLSGEAGGLTCSDCHSVHDVNTVTPFVGDRLRSEDETTTGTASNRLLKKFDGANVYGTEWCEHCHKGSDMGHPLGSTSSTITADYSNVRLLSGYDTTVVAGAKGSLGGNNFGYSMPLSDGDRQFPICQQCHEDSRQIANDMDARFEISSVTESFSPSVDGVSDGNPRFQNFPHETVNSKMLVEVEDSLCLNCHDVADESAAH